MFLTDLDSAWIPCLPASTASQATLEIRKGVGLGISFKPLRTRPASQVLMPCCGNTMRWRRAGALGASVWSDGYRLLKREVQQYSFLMRQETP